MRKLAAGDRRSFYSLHQQAIDQVVAKADALQKQLEGAGIASAMQATNLAAASANDSAKEINPAAATLGHTAIQLTATVANKKIADGAGSATNAHAGINAQVPATTGTNAF